MRGILNISTIPYITKGERLALRSDAVLSSVVADMLLSRHIEVESVCNAAG